MTRWDIICNLLASCLTDEDVEELSAMRESRAQSKPLEVEWLCRLCHSDEHARESA